MKKKNNLNHILEEIVNQYIGDFSLHLENKTELSTEKNVITKIKNEMVNEKKEETNEKDKDQQMMLESLKEEFFTMLNTTKKIEEKKDLSDELEEIAKTFF